VSRQLTAERQQWLRTNIADVAGNGGTITEADLWALPTNARSRALEIAKETLADFQAGNQERSRGWAREQLHALEQEIPASWRPPREERPSRELLDEIRGVVR
jgi:hypothetical protein